MDLHTDEELIRRLEYLGIDQSSYRAIALLPLVEVAWADGAVQRAEKDLIVKVAEENYFDMGDGARILQGWLESRPSEEYFAKGRELLVALAQRDRGLGADLGADTLVGLLDLCERVASSAGGLFGLAFTVESREREAIRQISRALALAPRVNWTLHGEE